MNISCVAGKLCVMKESQENSDVCVEALAAGDKDDLVLLVVAEE